ncbi:hypothetical protein RF11_12696 [Thelohanellus kitauei]|uniref:Uncharacterized protein n=1 Tax=Thelohanellus kitauei TaxID=669202 RepID=A0A0C2JBY4_THEKT|nr:hypothetical protein RF11_12696 [Thelohanellus kitauei]
MTKNKKQQLYIIYFTLVVYPMIDKTANDWLYMILKELYDSVRMYIEKNLFKDVSLENQFHLTQYYLKSLITLKIPMSNLERAMLNWFFKFLSAKQHLSNVY